jgi:hypothetical protein
MLVVHPLENIPLEEQEKDGSVILNGIFARRACEDEVNITIFR